MDDLGRRALGEVGRATARDRPERGAPRSGSGPWRTTRPVGVDDLDRVVGVERALDARAPRPRAASGPATRAHAGRRRRRRPDPPRRSRTRSRACGSAAARPGAARRCPTCTPASASATTVGASAAAITVRIPDQDAIFAAASLLAIPPLPRSVPVPARDGLERSSTAAISSMSEASASRRGSAVNRPGGVGEQHQHVGAAPCWRPAPRCGRCRRSGSRRRRRVSFSFTTGSTPELEQPAAACRGRAGTGCGAPKSYGVSEHLARDHVVLGEDRAEPLHQPRLADRGDRLQRLDVGRAPVEAERGHARRDRARAHEQHLVARAARGDELAGRACASAASSISPDGAVIDDVPTFTTASISRLQIPSTYSSSTGPIRTTSPSRAPARASAFSTPMRRNRCWT